MNKTLYCDISSHGFGHVAQSAPILNRLHQLRPDIDIVIQCAAEPEWLTGNFTFSFEHVHLSSDFGMVMEDALRVDSQASHQRYVDLHKHWPERVSELAQAIRRYQPTALYSNVSYLSNAAAATLSIPVINLCSLNWYGVYKHYCESLPGAQQVMDDMLTAYRSAHVFLAPEPSMPMPEIARLRHIGTVARRGQPRAADIRRQHGLEGNSCLVLVSHGGVGLDIDFKQWPVIDGVYYLIAGEEDLDRKGFIHCESLAMPHIDIMCSSDVIITKAGYGTYAECACHCIPIAYTKRYDWPEEAYLNQWLQKTGRSTELPVDYLQRGELQGALSTVLQQQKKPAVEPTGVEQAVQALLQFF